MSYEQKRRKTAASATRYLEQEISLRREELAKLERAHDVIATLDERGECTHWREHAGAMCAGELHSGFCRECGFVAIYCEQHGGSRAAAAKLAHHQRSAHASTPSKTQDAG